MAEYYLISNVISITFWRISFRSLQSTLRTRPGEHMTRFSTVCFVSILDTDNKRGIARCMHPDGPLPAVGLTPGCVLSRVVVWLSGSALVSINEDNLLEVDDRVRVQFPMQDIYLGVSSHPGHLSIPSFRSR